MLHPLEERLPDGTVIKFYEEAEAVPLHLKRRGTPMILRAVADGKFKPFSFSGMQKIVQRMRKELEFPTFFTLDACRHGGMTELEEAELTDGQGRALSAHRTKESYEGYTISAVVSPQPKTCFLKSLETASFLDHANLRPNQNSCMILNSPKIKTFNRS